MSETSKSMIPDGFRELFLKTKVRNIHEAAMVATHYFTLEVGFKYVPSDNGESVDNLRKLIEKNKYLVILKYSHPTCQGMTFILRYVYIHSEAMLYAFAGDKVANCNPIGLEQYINEDADFWDIDEVYPKYAELSVKIKNEYILKMLSEAQYDLNVPQSFGISRIPYYTLENIFKYLNLNEAVKCMTVNKEFHDVLNLPSYWKYLYEIRFPKPHHYMENLRKNGVLDWKQSYRMRLNYLLKETRRKEAMMRKLKAKKEERCAKRLKLHNNIVYF